VCRRDEAKSASVMVNTLGSYEFLRHSMREAYQKWFDGTDGSFVWIVREFFPFLTIPLIS
jgi:hypothetical protein